MIQYFPRKQIVCPYKDLVSAITWFKFQSPSAMQRAGSKWSTLESEKLLAPTPVFVNVLPHKHIITHASIIAWLAFQDIINKIFCVYNLLINSQQIGSIHVGAGETSKHFNAIFPNQSRWYIVTCENETTKYKDRQYHILRNTLIMLSFSHVK